jgi:hypothetical protein
MPMRRFPSPAPRFGLVLARAAAALAVVSAAGVASAEPEFPGIIQEHFAVGCAPQCTLCHTSPTGGENNLKGAEKYVDGMNPSHRGYGVFISNLNARAPSGTPSPSNLNAKLASLEKEPCNKEAAMGSTADTGPCDSDGDGTSDFEELKKGYDPDTAGPGPECPAYGCGASIGTLPRDADANGRAGAVIAALGVALVLARRVRR